jgi:hypothetical protein
VDIIVLSSLIKNKRLDDTLFASNFRVGGPLTQECILVSRELYIHEYYPLLASTNGVNANFNYFIVSPFSRDDLNLFTIIYFMVVRPILDGLCLSPLKM